MISSKRIVPRILFLTIVAASCTNEKIGDKSVIMEGVGVDDLAIGTLTIEEIKSQL